MRLRQVDPMPATEEGFDWSFSDQAQSVFGLSPRPNKGGSAQSRHVTRLLAQICNAELTAGHSELKILGLFFDFL